MTSHPESSASERPTDLLPCVVQLGFGGSRHLLPAELDDATRTRLETRLQEKLVALLGPTGSIRSTLKMEPWHFFCGISQLAIGADMIFTRACLELNLPQRIFLPQHLAGYLQAIGSDGKTPDFNDAERAEAHRLLRSSHVIQERVVSHSGERSEQFIDTNLEIARVCDVVICLLSEKADPMGKAGGTQELARIAVSRGCPVLELRVSMKNDDVELIENWTIPGNISETTARKDFPTPPPKKEWRVPRLPWVIEEPDSHPTLASLEGIPSSDIYCQCLKAFASDKANENQRKFKWDVREIIGTHFLATLLATLVVVLHGCVDLDQQQGNQSHAESVTSKEEHNVDHAPVSSEVKRETPAETHAPEEQDTHHVWLFSFLLAVELLMIGRGLWVHRQLHHSNKARRWAWARLIAEVVRSMQAIGPRYVYLEHLFHLSLPAEIRHLLRTLSVVHLKSTRPVFVTMEDHSQRTEAKKLFDQTEVHGRHQYVENRLTHPDPKKGQIAYYRQQIDRDQRNSKRMGRLFAWLSAAAFAATQVKLICIALELIDDHKPAEVAFMGLLSTFAILLPVLASAMLSWLAAMDSEARLQTFQETLEFLEGQVPLLEQAGSMSEFNRLLIETEARLLGETANWFSRRTFINVS